MKLSEQIKMLKLLSTNSDCLHTKVAALILNKGMVIGFGVNSSSVGKSCKLIGKCNKNSGGFGHGEGHLSCLAIHAEVKAIGNAFRNGYSLGNTEIFVTHKPCSYCAKLIVESGISKVIYINDYKDVLTDKIFKYAGIRLLKIVNNEKIEIIL